MAEDAQAAAGAPASSDPNPEKDKRERSQIVFPYSDMKEGIAVAQAIWSNVATAACELPQLAVEARTTGQALTDAREVAGWLQELDDPATAAQASRRLVAWLLVRARTTGTGQDA